MIQFLSNFRVGGSVEENFILGRMGLSAPCCPHPSGVSQSSGSTKGEYGAGLGRGVLWRGGQGWQQARRVLPANKHSILCPPKPTALRVQDSWQPVPVCRCPFHFCRAKRSCQTSPLKPGERFLQVSEEWWWPGEGVCLRVGGFQNPLFRGRGRLATLELSFLPSLVLAAVQVPAGAQKV